MWLITTDGVAWSVCMFFGHKRDQQTYRQTTLLRKKNGVAWSDCMSVCLLVTFMSPAKTAEPIDMRICADSR